jgi:hypothetical protein
MVLACVTSGVRRQLPNRGIVVVAVPPIDELDLVGPLQVFNSVNRLAGRTIYTIELVTAAERLTVEGEGGVRWRCGDSAPCAWARSCSRRPAC